MRFGLNDNTVKRIAALAHHTKGGNMVGNISSIYHNISHSDTIDRIAGAHTTDAMQHKFKHKNDENTFKAHLATAAAINRGTIPLDKTNVMKQNANPEA